MSKDHERTALVVCYSKLQTDPRVVRQVGWLNGDGWIVDTLGLGPRPHDAVRTHYSMVPAPRVTEPLIVRALIHAGFTKQARFNALVGSQIPHELRNDRPDGGYDLIVVSDIDLLPWVVKHGPRLLSDDPAAKIHLDLHEYHHWAPSPDTPFATRALMGGYHSWMTSLISSPVFASRSTVADGIADLYENEFGIVRPSIVRNSPAYVEQAPGPVDKSAIQLIYHGNAEMARGLDLLIDAVSLLDDRFELNLMLTGSESGKARLHELTADLGDRVVFHEAVPMNEVSRKLNAFDLEIIFYPPTSPNFLYSFPNKFFEAVQGRIGVVIGQSPSMTAIVRRFGNGTIIEGWGAKDLAAGLNRLAADEIEVMKRGASACAGELNSEVEGGIFLRDTASGYQR